MNSSAIPHVRIDRLALKRIAFAQRIFIWFEVPAHLGSLKFGFKRKSVIVGQVQRKFGLWSIQSFENLSLVQL